MATKKPAEKKAPKKGTPPRTLNPVKPSSDQAFSNLVKRLHKDPDFEAFIRLLEDYREDYNQAGYDPEVIKDKGLNAFYGGARFALDNLLNVISSTLHPDK